MNREQAQEAWMAGRRVSHCTFNGGYLEKDNNKVFTIECADTLFGSNPKYAERWEVKVDTTKKYKNDVRKAMVCAKTGKAHHWSTIAGVLSDEVKRLRDMLLENGICLKCGNNVESTLHYRDCT